MGKFEQAWPKQGGSLFVLSPESSKYNGNVERKNGVGGMNIN